jgi:hypothetical protein
MGAILADRIDLARVEPICALNTAADRTVSDCQIQYYMMHGIGV